MSDAGTDLRKRWAAVAALAATPFLIGRALPVSAPGSLPVICPLRAATGVPCPLCGATRSVVMAAHADPAFWSYNPVWVLVLVAILLVSVAGAILGSRLPRPRPGRLAAAAGALVLGAGWIVSLSHRKAIVS